ncbi:NAD-dependent epimerase/dehydratase family protein [Cohnella thailandensis]|uniref:NAD(P)-dependent oxidoreductase n=1 Tax=Cohnella thailandensis TaxID=557557 RepID=A0A841T8I0_9BACL|nr:NAD(P)-dependent oxidoreductase [Cohnella thailandensis]MBB6637491.1 NAD(P)-dependent oxidoreductase [Cohnella thailandensis]MBP1977524.1 nucleoside-diphosphate-sugar epimerase [Cohnella thailandensis]
MKVFVAGASGVIGRLLVPKLLAAGHDVYGMTHKKENERLVQRLGAKPVLADAFDKEAVKSAIGNVRPDAIFHQLTALSEWNTADNARIRTEGTRNLVEAALEAGVERMIAQSISWAYEPGPEPATEDVPLDIEAPLPYKTTVDGVIALERSVAEMPEHVILRYGLLYGPGTWYDRNGLMADRVRQAQVPATEGITSLLHVEDAAVAALLALGWPAGPVNIADDEPAAEFEWLPVYADALGAPAPDRQTGRKRGQRGASNAKARSEYGWKPVYPTWRSGLAHSLSVRPSETRRSKGDDIFDVD